MAKLSARGRSEVFRVEREQTPAPSADPTAVIWRKSTIVLMSDGSTLEKDQVKFPPSFPGSKPRLHDWGWKKRGRLGAGKDPKLLLEQFAKKGYLVAAAQGISGFDAAYYRALAASRPTTRPEPSATPPSSSRDPFLGPLSALSVAPAQSLATPPAAASRPGMQPLTREQENELVNLYHLARTPLSGTGKDTRYNRMLWASREYEKTHPETSSTAAYKHLDRILT